MAEIQIALEIQKKRVTDKTEVQELLMMLLFIFAPCSRLTEFIV